jgi:succinyl-CoA synthetase beta subunit
MKLHEIHGKALLQRAGVPVPAGEAAASVEEARAAAERIGRPVVVKAQLLAPGRGKRGGIRLAATPGDAAREAGALLGATFGPETCRRLLVEEQVSIARELYAAVLVDARRRQLLVLLAAEGGGDIEELFARAPERVIRHYQRPLAPFHPFLGRKLARELGLTGGAIGKVGAVVGRLVEAARRYEARLVEVNPLAITEAGEAVAVDAVVNLDEDAFFRHPDFKALGIEMEEERPRPPTPREIAAVEIDKQDYRGVVHYQDIDADGDVGVVSVGSGFSLTLQDILHHYSLKPANFCDCSGSPPASKVYQSVKLVFSNPKIRGFLFMSGVVTQDLTVTAEGIVQAYQELRPGVPFVVRLAGNRDREAYTLLKAAGIEHVFRREDAIETCVEKVKSLMAAGAAVGVRGAS